MYSDLVPPSKVKARSGDNFEALLNEWPPGRLLPLLLASVVYRVMRRRKYRWLGLSSVAAFLVYLKDALGH